MFASHTARAFQLFLLAMSVLTLEVALTRIFSFIMYHHFTYLVISTAMLGFGAAGTHLTLRGKDDDAAAADDFVARHAALFGLAAIGAVILIPRIRFFPMDIYFRQDYSQLLSLLIIMVFAAAPFFFAGACIGYLICRAGERVNRAYFADLTGAAIGALLALVLINLLGGIATCLAIAIPALFVAAMSGARHRGRYIVGLLLAGVLTAWIARTEWLPLYAPPNKQMFRREHLIDTVKWHVITRLDVTQPQNVYYSLGGSLSHEYRGEPLRMRVIYQDASALTGIIQPTPTPRETPALGYYLQGAPCAVRSGADALVIGYGGGSDIMIALHHGAEHVVGVDINPHMRELVGKTFRDFSHGAFNRDDVELITAEGRHFLTCDDRRFDVIQLSGVDTFSALSTGAYALSENFIYTAEAMDQYLAHLKANGIVNISRPLFDPPRETLKLIATAVEALERRGVREPSRHIMILAGKGQESPCVWAQTMVKHSPFTREEVRILTEWTNSLGFDVLCDPFTDRPSELEALCRATPAERERIIAGHRLNIRPATDDKPFFFQFYRWSDLLAMNPRGRGGVRPPLALLILLGSLVQVMVLSAVFILYPLFRRRAVSSARGGRAAIFAYFAALGLGFIVIEIALLQKLTVFLGGPAYSMSITLFTILLASGIGSFLSRNWANRPFRLLVIVVPLLAVGTVAESFSLDLAISNLMGVSRPLRCAAAVVLVAPLGLLMGMPFPAGLRHVDRFRPELNPWAWGINACATVAGAVVCILISALWGFRTALIVGALIYLLGWLVFAASQGRATVTREVSEANMPPDVQLADGRG